MRRRCLRIDWYGSSTRKSPFHSIHPKRRLTGWEQNKRIAGKDNFDLRKFAALGFNNLFRQKDYCWAFPRMNILYGRLANSKRLGCTRNRHNKLKIIFAVESIGVDGIRWKRAQHGARSQLFFGRQRESQDQWNSINSKQNRLNSQQLICPQKRIGMGGNRWIGVHHAASAQHFPGALARHGFKCLNASILISVLQF